MHIAKSSLCCGNVASHVLSMFGGARSTPSGFGSSTPRVKAVQRMLGHALAAMTLDVYAGLFADDMDALAERLDDVAARAGAD
jgi:integrase